MESKSNKSSCTITYLRESKKIQHLSRHEYGMYEYLRLNVNLYFMQNEYMNKVRSTYNNDFIFSLVSLFILCYCWTEKKSSWWKIAQCTTKFICTESSEGLLSGFLYLSFVQFGNFSFHTPPIMFIYVPMYVSYAVPVVTMQCSVNDKRCFTLWSYQSILNN